MKKIFKLSNLIVASLLTCSSLFATCANDIDMGGHRITNVGEPIEDSDVITKGYLDNKINSNSVSFSATNEYFSYITFPSTIVESSVNINESNSFNPESGVFTAPSNGVYLFNLDILIDTFYGKNADGSNADLNDSKWREDKHIYIKKFNTNESVTLNGGTILGKVWIGMEGKDSNGNVVLGHRKAGSRSVIVKLEEGEKVCVQFLKWDNSEEGDKIKAIIHFSGFKLH